MIIVEYIDYVRDGHGFNEHCRIPKSLNFLLYTRILLKNDTSYITKKCRTNELFFS